MCELRLLPALALTATLLLPSGVTLAQDDVAETFPAAEGSVAAEDARQAELEALVPATLAGLPLAENLQVATGEQLMSVMRPEEAAIIEDLLAANGMTAADYAAATSWLPVGESDVVVIQAHRIAGLDAAETVDAWVEILFVNLEDPRSSEDLIAGRPVTLVSDASSPEVPPLHLFPARDTMWMVVADDQAVVEEAMDAVGADEAEESEPAD